MTKYIKEPGSAITHFIGVILGLPGTFILMYITKTRGLGVKYMFSIAVFGIAMILLYLTSTLYHSILSTFFWKLDHMMIFTFIAASYTPICIHFLFGVWGVRIMIIIWSITICGIIYRIICYQVPKWINGLIYTSMGCALMIAIYPLYKVLSYNILLLLMLGEIFYIIGALVFIFDFPKLKYKYFSYHEIFHILILTGTVCHYLMLYYHINSVSH